MSWYNPASWSGGDVVGGFVAGGPLGAIVNGASGGAITNQITGAITSDPGAEAERQRRLLLYQQAQQAGGFADQSQQGYQQLGQQGQGALEALRQQASGQNSVSAEQLRQALQQQLAQQRSLAAGASPQNAAMAARTAAIQSARLSSGLVGQQAIAGLQERNQAQQQYGSLLGQLRGQDLNAALGSRQTAVTGYGAGNAGAPEKSWIEKYGPAIQSGASAAAAMSDRLLKTDIRDGGPDANKAIEGLRAYAYRYKDPQYGAGPQVGVMAQDLERAGLRQAVVDTPAGKAIDAGKLSGANTAMIAALGRRVAELERAGADPQAATEQAKLEARRQTLDPDTARRNRAYDAALLDQTDPKAAAAQQQLNTRRAAIAPAPAQGPAPLLAALARRAAMGAQ